LNNKNVFLLIIDKEPINHL